MILETYKQYFENVIVFWSVKENKEKVLSSKQV